MGRKRKVQALLATLIAWPAWAQDYNPTLLPPQLLGSPQTMVALNGGDDSTRMVQLGFPFEYYGNVYTSAWVSSNGFVSFQSAAHLCCDGVPMEQAQRNTIYGYWTDLVSGGNPYYRTSEDSALFGWYDTREYGTNNSVTFEIGLFPDNKIQFNFGSLANSWHTVSAGITGPTSADNIQLFYGANVQNLQNQSGLLSPIAAEPVFTPVAAPTPNPAPSPLAAAALDQEEQVSALEAAVDEIVAAEEAAIEPVAEAVSEAVEETAAEEATQEDAEDASGAPPPPGLVPGGPPSFEGGIMVSGSRRDSNVRFFQSEAVAEADMFPRETVLQASLQNVAFVAQADAQYVQQFGEQTTTEPLGATYVIQPAEGPTFAPAFSSVIANNTPSPSGQAQQLEALGMQGEMAAGQTIDVGDVNSGDSEAMSQLAAVPAGYSDYTQARIPDMPFYQPKDIYKGRRISDANLALYRMMQGQDQRWNEMVEDQYE
jgi:hypothetical protein